MFLCGIVIDPCEDVAGEDERRVVDGSCDNETIRMAERMVVLRSSTKHVNLWIRRMDMTKNEVCELAGLIGLEEIKEIGEEKRIERWARRCTNFFTKIAKRMLFAGIDNNAWSGSEKEVSGWCKLDKVYDEVTENEIEEIWNRESPDIEENIRLNGKCVWETAHRVCDFINPHDDIVQITSLGEVTSLMKNVMMVIKEVHNMERKRRQTAKKTTSEEATKGTQRAKALVAIAKRGRMRKDEVMRSLEEIFSKGSGQEIAKADTVEKIVERIEELSKREEQLQEWENLRRESKRRQREDRRLNLFRRKNQTFSTQYGGDEETPDAD